MKKTFMVVITLVAALPLLAASSDSTTSLQNLLDSKPFSKTQKVNIRGKVVPKAPVVSSNLAMSDGRIVTQEGVVITPIAFENEDTQGTLLTINKQFIDPENEKSPFQLQIVGFDKDYHLGALIIENMSIYEENIQFNTDQLNNIPRVFFNTHSSPLFIYSQNDGKVSSQNTLNMLFVETYRES